MMLILNIEQTNEEKVGKKRNEFRLTIATEKEKR